MPCAGASCGSTRKVPAADARWITPLGGFCLINSPGVSGRRRFPASRRTARSLEAAHRPMILDPGRGPAGDNSPKAIRGFVAVSRQRCKPTLPGSARPPGAPGTTSCLSIASFTCSCASGQRSIETEHLAGHPCVALRDDLHSRISIQLEEVAAKARPGPTNVKRHQGIATHFVPAAARSVPYMGKSREPPRIAAAPPPLRQVGCPI